MPICSTKRWLALGLLAFLVSTLAACQWVDRNKAEAVAKRFVRAVVNSDFAAVRNAVDPDDNGFSKATCFMSDKFHDYYWRSDDEGLHSRKRERLDDLTLETIYQDEKSATILAIGTYCFTGADWWMRWRSCSPFKWEIGLIKKNGRWYVHDVDDRQHQVVGCY